MMRTRVVFLWVVLALVGACVGPGTQPGDDDSKPANNTPEPALNPDFSLLSFHGGTGEILEIDRETGVANVYYVPTNLTSTVSSAALSEDGLLYGVQDSDGRMFTIDPCTGLVTLFGSPTGANGCGVSFGPGGNLYALNISQDRLYSFNTTSGSVKDIGALGWDVGTCALAFDPDTNRLIGYDGSTGTSFVLNTTSGEATALGSTGLPLARVGLAYEPSTRTLWIADGENLRSMDPRDGTTALVGAIGYSNVDDLILYRGDPLCP